MNTIMCFIIYPIGYYLFTICMQNIDYKSIINILINNPDLITAISTLILALVTLFLVLETYNIRKFQSNPIIALQTRPLINTPQDILLSIINCGNGVAKNIHLYTESTFPVTYIPNSIPIELKELGVFKHRFDLAAQQKFEFLLKYLPENYEDLRKKGLLKFSISVEYEDYQGKKFKPIKYDFDLELYHHLQFPSESPTMNLFIMQSPNYKQDSENIK